MKRKFLILVSLLTLFGLALPATAASTDQLHVTPWPNRIEVTGPQESDLSRGVRVTGADPFLKTYLLQECALTESREGVKITLRIDPSQAADSLTAEGYTLRVDKKGVWLAAADSTGLFYGLQTLRQLITPAKTLPYVQIEDAPAFSWRAFMLDEVRYFRGKEVVFQLLDRMARLKMNVFHWHLTDDVGWRIEIKQYPLLTEIGSRRDSTEIGTWRSGRYDGKPHGGFYTQDEIREVIAYATARHITIVPEIEMPGHASAAIAAYPWLGVTGEIIRVPAAFAGHPWIYNVADPRVMRFLEEVIDEVTTLFSSSPVIHIGGDEVPYGQWKLSPQVTALMKERGMKNYSDVQVDFTNRMSRYIDSLGRRMMGWNEIMGMNVHEWSDEANASGAATLAPDAIVHFWKGDPENIREALRRGHNVVNSTHNFTYLDYSYETLPLKKAYGFDPVPEGVSAEEAARILGLGCQMWCEWVPTLADLQRQVFPRIAAYAETGWTRRENKDYDRFLRQLPGLKVQWGVLAGEAATQ